MCALCGVLGGKGHWSDSASAPAAFAGRAEPQTRLRERQARTRLLNVVLKHYGIVVSDWSGNAYLLTSLTGRTAIVETISEIWRRRNGSADASAIRSTKAYLAKLADGAGSTPAR